MLPGGTAQPKRGVACSKRIRCGMGGQKMEKLCGIVWTQNGGDFCKSGCDMGIKVIMAQNVCGMGCFLIMRILCPINGKLHSSYHGLTCHHN